MKAYTDLEVDGLVVAEKFKTNGGTTSQLVQGDGGLIDKTTFATETHNHSASNITSGTLAIARIPTGTSSTQVALGNHTHTIVDVTNLQKELYTLKKELYTLKKELDCKEVIPKSKTITLADSDFTTIHEEINCYNATDTIKTAFQDGHSNVLFELTGAGNDIQKIILGLGDGALRDTMTIGKVYTIVIDNVNQSGKSVTISVSGWQDIPRNTTDRWEILKEVRLHKDVKPSFIYSDSYTYTLYRCVVIQVVRLSGTRVSVLHVSQPQIIY